MSHKLKRTDEQLQELRNEVTRIQEVHDCSRPEAYVILSAQVGRWWSDLAPNTISTYANPRTMQSKRTYYQRRKARLNKAKSVSTPRATRVEGKTVSFDTILQAIQSVESRGIVVTFD